MKPTLLLIAFMVAACSSSSSEGKGDGATGGAGGQTDETGGKGGGGKGGSRPSAGGAAGGSSNGGSAGGNAGAMADGGQGPGGAAGGGAGATAMTGDFLTPGIDGPAPAAPGCLEFKAKAFDFVSSHDDFQFATYEELSGATSFVTNTLGKDGNPVLGADITKAYVKSADTFKQWFTSVPGTNKVVDITLKSVKRSAALYTFGGDDTGWYPIDGQGQGNTDFVPPDAPKDAAEMMLDASHNQLFTMKMEAQFYYQGGKAEVIISESDDDSWVFINGKLAIDNGGLHGFIPASVKLDDHAAELGLKPGKHYPITFFYAEREFGGAKYRVSHNLLFDCAK